MQDRKPKAVAKPALWSALLLGEIVWCFLASRTAGNWTLEGAASLFAANSFGCVCGIFSGFLFTSSGKEEESTFGKLRDWLLAGVTGAGAAEIMDGGGTVKSLLLQFSFGPQKNEFALVFTTAAIGFTAGFFFMFFQRELHLNVLLANARSLTARAENAQSASTVLHELLSKLPPFLLTEINDVSESELSAKDRTELEQLLNSDEVKEFLAMTKEKTDCGAALDWDTVSKTAFIQYYRTYFTGKENQDAQIDEAQRWVRRALIMEPNHAALTVAYADLHSLQGDYANAARLTKDLIAAGDPPATAFLQLGYYLLEDGKDRQSIQYSRMYLELYPDDAATCFNLAFCYGRLYCAHHDDADLRKECLRMLDKGLRLEPAHAAKIRSSWFDDGIACLQEDSELNALLKRAEARSKASASAPANNQQQADAG